MPTKKRGGPGGATGQGGTSRHGQGPDARKKAKANQKNRKVSPGFAKSTSPKVAALAAKMKNKLTKKAGSAKKRPTARQATKARASRARRK